MSEISQYESYKKKLQGVCDENDLVFRFVRTEYPHYPHHQPGFRRHDPDRHAWCAGRR